MCISEACVAQLYKHFDGTPLAPVVLFIIIFGELLLHKRNYRAFKNFADVSRGTLAKSVYTVGLKFQDWQAYSQHRKITDTVVIVVAARSPVRESSQSSLALSLTQSANEHKTFMLHSPKTAWTWSTSSTCINIRWCRRDGLSLSLSLTK